MSRRYDGCVKVSLPQIYVTTKCFYFLLNYGWLKVWLTPKSASPLPHIWFCPSWCPWEPQVQWPEYREASFSFVQLTPLEAISVFLDHPMNSSEEQVNVLRWQIPVSRCGRSVCVAASFCGWGRKVPCLLSKGCDGGNHWVSPVTAVNSGQVSIGRVGSYPEDPPPATPTLASLSLFFFPFIPLVNTDAT